MNVLKPLSLILSVFSFKNTTPGSTDTSAPSVPASHLPIVSETMKRTEHEYIEWEDKFVKEDRSSFANFFGRTTKHKQICSVRLFDIMNFDENEIRSLPVGWEPFAVRYIYGGGSYGLARKCVDIE